MRLSDFIDINPKVSLSKKKEYPFIKMEIVTPGHRYIRARNKREYKGGGAKFQNRDTIFARITPCLENGKIAQYIGPKNEPAFGSTEFFVFRNKKGVSDPDYVFYLASTEIIRKPAEKSMSGASGRQRADIASIKDVDVLAPSLPTQRKIASILSAYDDLIDNNLRRIKILEEIAQMIYHEWFVHFRFPGHEKVKMVDSVLGKIPEGWVVMTASECLQISPRINVDKKTIRPFVNMGGLSDNSMIVEQTDIRKGSNGSKFQKNDTLFARITPCLENGKTGFVQFLDDKEVGLGSTEFIVLRSINLSPEIVYLLARTEDFRNNAIKSMSGASGRQRVRNECFDKYLLAKSENDIINKFTNIVKPMFENIYNLFINNSNLRKTRDLLLPKLINGEIDVEKINA